MKKFAAMFVTVCVAMMTSACGGGSVGLHADTADGVQVTGSEMGSNSGQVGEGESSSATVVSTPPQLPPLDVEAQVMPTECGGQLPQAEAYLPNHALCTCTGGGRTVKWSTLQMDPEAPAVCDWPVPSQIIVVEPPKALPAPPWGTPGATATPSALPPPPAPSAAKTATPPAGLVQSQSLRTTCVANQEGTYVVCTVAKTEGALTTPAEYQCLGQGVGVLPNFESYQGQGAPCTCKGTLTPAGERRWTCS
ncbi:MAG: hypothetical protein ACOYUZ_06275 [Patescibacteria group bacterium]